jgi:hypothetical protein
MSSILYCNFLTHFLMWPNDKSPVYTTVILGTARGWHADPRFLVRLLRLHDEILGSARLNWERHSYISDLISYNFLV